MKKANSPVVQMPGDCRCKTNVIGSQCDRCRDGSYNMSPTNPDGCQSKISLH